VKSDRFFGPVRRESFVMYYHERLRLLKLRITKNDDRRSPNDQELLDHYRRQIEQLNKPRYERRIHKIYEEGT
jgi:hypothetical protein